MIGILTEKPSACRNFSKALGGMSGTYNGEDYVLVHSAGHLYELIPPAEQVPKDREAFYKSWDTTHLPWNETEFAWKKKATSGSSKLLKEIHDTLKTCDEIVIATDNDPSGEGDLLAWEILEGQHLTGKRYSRMYFADESEKEIRKAFVSRKPIPSFEGDPAYDKAVYRSEWDFLSMQFTRIATACGDGRAVLRQGRLKSAMVRLTGDQLTLVASYKKIPYYQNRFRDDHGVIYTDPDEPTFPKKEDVPVRYHASDVVVDSKERKRTPPGKLLDLASLSAILAGEGISAKECLDTYQKMYTDSILSYPRTEDRCVTKEQFNELLPLINQIAEVAGVDPGLLTHRQMRPAFIKSGQAHGANRPGPNVPKSLDSLSKYGRCAARLYEVVARNYLAMLAEDYEYEAQKGHVKDYPTFKGHVSVPLSLGWKTVFGEAADKAEDENSRGLGSRADPFVYEGFPKKPASPTMKWLMKQLERRDVGTGATRTSIYADVTSARAKYPLLMEKRGRLSMTKYGEMSYRLLKDTYIGDLTITEQLMRDMRGVADGTVNARERLRAMQEYVRHDLAVMQKNGLASGGGKDQNMEQTQKEKAAGVWNGEEIKFNRVWGGHRFTDEEVEALLNGQTIQINGLQGSDGSYGVTGHLAHQEYNGHPYVGFERLSVVSGESSGSDSRPQKEKYTGTWKKKQVSFNRVWGGHRFTDEECAALCRGESITVEHLQSKSGSEYGVTGHLAKQIYKGHSFVGFERTGFLDS